MSQRKIDLAEELTDLRMELAGQHKATSELLESAFLHGRYGYLHMEEKELESELTFWKEWKGTQEGGAA